MRQVVTGSTDQTVVVYAYDENGEGVELTSASAGLSLSYRIDQNGREGDAASLTPVARLIGNTHRDGAITSRGDGKHEIDLPDLAFATNDSVVTVELSATGVEAAFAEKVIVQRRIATVIDVTNAALI